MTSRETIAHSALWSTYDAVSKIGLQLIGLVVLARLLPPAEFGLGALAVAVVYLLNLMVERLFADALVQRYELNAMHLDSAFWVVFGLAIVLMSVCTLNAETIAKLCGEPRLAPLLRWMCAIVAFTAFNATVTAKLRRGMQFKKIMIGSLLSRFVSTSLAIAMAASGYGVWCFVGQQLGLFATMTLVYWFIGGWRPRLRFSLRHLQQLSKFAAGGFLIELVAVGHTQILAVLVGGLFGPAALGYFSIATRLTDNLSSVIVTVTHQVSMTVFSRKQRDPASLQKSVYDASRFICFIALPVFGGIYVCAEDLVAVMFGDTWADAAPLAQLLACGAMIYFTVSAVQTALEASGHPAWHVFAYVTELVTSVVGLISFADLGVIAAGYVVVIGQVLSAPISYVVTRRFIPIEATVIVAHAFRPLLAVTAMILLLTLFRSYSLMSWPDWERLLVLIALGGGIYLGIMWFIAAPLVRETSILLVNAMRRP